MTTYLSRTPLALQYLFPKIRWRLSDGEKGPLLTFDDGPNPNSTPVLLQALDDSNINAEFFVLGKNAEKWPQLVEDIRSRGHMVSSHGYKHIDGWKTSATKYIDNARKGCEICKSNRFRPPFGRLTPIQYHRLHNLQIVMWSYMLGDFDKSRTVDNLANRLLNETKSNDIIVMHDSPEVVDKTVKLLAQWSHHLSARPVL